MNIKERMNETLTKTEELILKYIDANASEELKKKIESSEKDIKDCVSWIAESVRERAVNGCAAVADDEVYGLAIHYFEEDDIKKLEERQDYPKTVYEKKVEKAVKEEKKKAQKEKNSQYQQMDMFSLMGVN